MPSLRHATVHTLTLLSMLPLSSAVAAEVHFVSSLPGTFIDISSTGTVVIPTDDGEFDITSTVGNSRFPAGTVRIGTNGGVRFGPALAQNGQLAPANTTIPGAGAFDGSVALLPYWDSYTTQNGLAGFSTIRYQEVNGTLIIQWQSMRLVSAPLTDRVTFQVQIPSSGQVFARFIYADISDGRAHGGRGATIAYQGPTSTNSAQHSFDADDAVADGTVLSLISQPVQSIFDGAHGTFIDISTSGTPLNLSNDGFATHVTAVRNELVQQGDLVIASNGGIRLAGTGTTLAGLNGSIPSPNAFGSGQALLPFWDDIDTQGGTRGNIFVREQPDRLIVQWENVGFSGSALFQRATFQVQIFDDSEVIAQFLYEDVEGARAARGGSATIGYQAGGITFDTSYSFNQPTVEDGTVLTLFRERGHGASYCTAAVNSTGVAARITAQGNDQVSQNNFFLLAQRLPLQSTAFFIVSDTTAFVTSAGGSQGNLCLGGAIGRGVGGIKNSGTTGRVQAFADLQALPSATGPFQVQAGATLNFQCWYRDSVGGVATSNFTDGLQVRFRP